MGAMDELLDAAAIERLSVCLQAAGLDPTATRRSVADLDGLKLRQRVDVVHDALLNDLPGDFAAARIVVDGAIVLPEFEGWILWPVGEAMTTLALAEGAVIEGLEVMAQLTERFTSEFSIRRLAAADLDAALGAALVWTEHRSPHVRRLASEGLRPYLPWATRVPGLIERPDATVAILDRLVYDSDEVVRRSAANHLNDISRHAPEIVVATATGWLDAAPDGHEQTTKRSVRHALRTLIKRGDPGALALLGYASDALSVSDLEVSPSLLSLPGSVEISFSVTNGSDRDASVAVDYVVHFVKKNATLAPKVFKLSSIQLAPGETATLSKRHELRQMTTRVHYPGVHEVEVQVNGQRHGRAHFEIVAPGAAVVGALAP